MYILGINAYGHGAAAALIKDGEIRFTIEQERLDRIKHSPHFPAEAIAECLKFEGISLDQVDKITFFSKPHLEVIGNFPHFIRYNGIY
jgi:carbamoyltransferase